jgi:hypothetical protein
MEEYARDASARKRLLAKRFATTQFLFVNKTRKSKCLSNSRDDTLAFSALFRHVQKSRLSSSLQRRRPASKIPTGLVTWRWKPPTKVPSFAPTRDAQPKVVSEEKAPDVESTQSNSHNDDNDLDIEEIVREEEQASLIPLPTPTSNHNNQDRPLALNRTIKGISIQLLEPYRARAGGHVSRLVEYCKCRLLIRYSAELI